MHVESFTAIGLSRLDTNMKTAYNYIDYDWSLWGVITWG